jgi:hypothetical protein
MYTASCLCGGIQFRIDAELGPIQICHCTQCRKAQGTPFATNVAVAASVFHFTRGAELLTEYESSPGKNRCFCRVCGSPIYSYRKSLPGVFRIRVGLIAEPIAAKPMTQFHVASRCNWWPLDESIAQHPKAS